MLPAVRSQDSLETLWRQKKSGCLQVVFSKVEEGELSDDWHTREPLINYELGSPECPGLEPSG